MSVLVKTNGSLFPSRVSELLDPARFFNSDLLDLGSDLFNWNVGSSFPTANITEHDADYLIELAAPGLEKKDFKIETNDRNITISAEKKEETKEKTKNYSLREYSYENFSRSFLLPDNIVSDKISAKYENGILMITVPKKEVTVSKPKKEIKVS